METVKHQVEFCVVGGGLAGMCAAIAAARRGVKTLLMHERPVLGGNASSEIRMWVCGAAGCPESGLVEEILLENLYRNSYPSYAVWDSVLYEKVRFQPNLTLLLNCSCLAAEMAGSRIRSIKGWQCTTQQFHQVEAQLFADCSGDSILAPLTGAECRFGRESRAEFGEDIEPKEADHRTMGMSCLLQARETDRPQPFVAPEWAYVYETDEAIGRDHALGFYQNFWYLELGGDGDSIADTETVRDELLKIAYGIWDHIKNRGDHEADNWVLEWVGFLPGKRESRRYVGDYILTQRDLERGDGFDDVVAFGGWPMDNHPPAGFYHRGEPNVNHPVHSPYQIPFRSLYSRNIDNLLFAGRNISVSHAALTSTRVMATCALLGQAVGTAAAIAVPGGLLPREVYQREIGRLQQMLMLDDCYLPGRKREADKMTQQAVLTASAGAPEKLRDGEERDRGHAWFAGAGDWAEYTFAGPRSGRVRVVFDSDLARQPRLNMVASFPLDVPHYAVPETLVKSFTLYGCRPDGVWFVLFQAADNRRRLVKIDLPEPVVGVRLVIGETRRELPVGIFSFEVIEEP